MTRPDDDFRAHDGQIDAPAAQDAPVLSARWCMASVILSALGLVGMGAAVMAGWW